MAHPNHAIVVRGRPKQIVVEPGLAVVHNVADEFVPMPTTSCPVALAQPPPVALP